MYFRFPDNPELDNFRSYQSFAEVFDPHVNKIWSNASANSDGPYTVAQWFQFIKLLYSRENLKANIGAFHQVIQNHYSDLPQYDDYYHQYLAEIPDDYLWVAHFLVPAERTTSKLKFYFRALDRQRSESVLSPPHCALRTSTISALCTPNDHTLFEKIKREADELLAYFTEKAHLKVAKGYWINGSHFVENLTNLWYRQTRYINGESYIKIQDVLGRTGAKIELSCTDEQVRAGVNFSLMFTQKATKDFRDPLYSILQYTTNPCTLIDWPLKEPGEHKPMLYGVELECVFDYQIREIIDAQYTPFFIAKSDSTISGSKRYAAELVTIPMSLKAHKRHWAHWFKKIDYGRFDTSKNTTNGFHVHMDRAGFEGDKHIRNLCFFYLNPANRDFLIHISERGSYDQMSRYSPIPSFLPGYSKIKAFKSARRCAEGARGIINLQKPATIEIRMFRGIVSFGELVKNLEFVDAAFQFCRGEKSVNSLSVKHFMEWLRKTESNRYTVLKKFMDQCKNFDELMTSCEIYNHVFNLTDPLKIIEVVNKSGLQLTNAHVTVLNKGRKRTFILDKTTNKLTMVVPQGSRLAEFDRSIESRYTRNTFAA